MRVAGTVAQITVQTSFQLFPLHLLIWSCLFLPL